MKFIYFGLLTTLLVSVTANFGRDFTALDALCALNRETPTALQKLKAPFGAQHRKEIVWRKETPENFEAVLALMQGVSVTPCDFSNTQEAKIAVRAIRLIERNPETETEQIVSEVTDFTSNKETRFVGKLFERIPQWYPPNGATTDQPKEMLTRDDGTLVIDLAKAPRNIYHGWTEPQAQALPGRQYLVEMEVKITGQARLQMGIDYWRTIGATDNGWDGACQKSNNCEGYLSDWFGPTTGNDWQTIRAPKAFMGN